MIFTSLQFIVFFLIVYLLYYLRQDNTYQKIIILISSIIFYGCANLFFLPILFVVSFASYYFAILISRCQDRSTKRRTLIAGIVLLLIILAVFKYTPLFISIYNSIFNKSFGLSLLYPIGLSFYLFQALGYVIGVYWGKFEPERSFTDYMLYTSFFPQILQGPIAKYEGLSVQFKEIHAYDQTNSQLGFQRILWGFFKKLVIADNLSIVIQPVLTDSNRYGGMTALFVIFLYSFQLYADFSGYTDIAIGCARMLGIKLGENFETPYLSVSISEFWRKWHISLGDWFREFLFFPILRSKRMSRLRKNLKKKNKALSKTIPNVIALIIFWFLIGLWHGADFAFILYGLYHGFFVIIESLCIKKKSREDITSKPLFIAKVFITFSIVTIGYVIFAPANLASTRDIIYNIFNNINIYGLLSHGNTNFRPLLAAFMGLLAFIALDIQQFRNPEMVVGELLLKKKSFVIYGIYILIMISILVLGAFGTQGMNEFAYFRF